MSAALHSSAAVTLSTGPLLSIDPAAIAANTRLLADRASGELMAVVKADGFGHGAELVARTALANGATWLGVTSLEEAFPLRRAGLRAPLLSWLNPVAADWAAGIAADVDLAVPGLAHLDAISRAVATAGPGSPVARVHLHLDTGMARDGAAPEDWVALCQAARQAELAGLIRVVGMMGHLGCAAIPLHPANATDRNRFAWGLEVARTAGLSPQHRHLAATAATLTDPGSHHTLVRTGAGLVGIDPSGTSLLRGALTLTAPVVSVRQVRAGTPVGYDHSWTAPHSTVLALLPVGYADGLPRAASGQAEVLIRGERRPVVGRISMDQAVVDLGAGSTLQPGESATVFGPGDQGAPTIADWAQWSGTLAHEIVTGIGPRVQRAVIPTAPSQPTPSDPAGSLLAGSRA